MENKFFKAQKIMDGVTAISGLGGEFAYLVEGTERALLIDGLAGIGSLKAFVRQLTDLPVSIALTHGHIDHNGAIYEYGECYVHANDIPMLFPATTNDEMAEVSARHCDPKAKLDYAVNGRFLKGDPHGITLDDVIKVKPVITRPIGEGDVFDLGGTQLEVLELAGHTTGTVVFLDRARRVIFSGDACNVNTLVGIPGSTSIEEYKENLESFAAKHLDSFDVMYGGHGPSAVDKVIIQQGIELCEKIMRREDDAFVSAHRGRTQLLALRRSQGIQPDNGYLCNILYVEDKIFKKEKSPRVFR